MKFNDLFEGWQLADYQDFISHQYLHEIERLLKDGGDQYSLNNYVGSILSDLHLLDAEAQRELIRQFVSHVSPKNIKIIFKIVTAEEDEISSVSNLYHYVSEYYGNNVDKFLQLVFNRNIMKHKDELVDTNAIQCITPSFALRDYQIKCIQEIKDIFLKSDVCLLHLPTGAGKTRTAIAYICEYLNQNSNQLVVWFADSAELCNQAAESFAFAWSNIGNRKINIYSGYQSSNFSLSGLTDGFVVFSLQKFRFINTESNVELKHFIESVGLVVFDEAHKVIAPTYLESVQRLLNKGENQIDTKFLGLTATPGRSFNNDEENLKLSHLFMNNKVMMTKIGYSSPIEYLQDKKMLAVPTFVEISYNNQKIQEDIKYFSSEEQLIKLLEDDINRNEAIIDNVKIQFQNEPNSKMIIFSCSIAHSKLLEMILNMKGYRAKVIDSNTTSISRRSYIERFVKPEGDVQILINYNVLTTGFDAPMTNSVLIARPTTSLVLYLQMIGRAMRGGESGGNDRCVIYTVNDEISDFNNMFEANRYWDKLWR